MQGKDIPLEALRGLAAVVVLLSHTILAFFPCRSALPFPGCDAGSSFASQPWFGLVNGTAAVGFFFVLSGFVLSRTYLGNGDHEIIVRGAIKRWPRLAGPVLMTTIASWAMFSFDLFHFREAGLAAGSPWLSAFGSTPPERIDFVRAVAQGAFLTFFRGDADYNWVLWTMRIEFVGSYVAFALALFLFLLKDRPVWLTWFVLAIACLACHWSDPLFTSFVVGVGLAATLPRRKLEAPAWAAVLMLLLAVYLFGYTGKAGGAYRLMERALSRVPLSETVTYVHVAGSVLLLVAAEASPAIRSALSAGWAALLGELSFPLYLVHLLLICSLASFVFLNAPAFRYVAAPATAIVASVLMAFPLMWFNRWWIGTVNRRTLLLAARAKALSPSTRS